MVTNTKKKVVKKKATKKVTTAIVGFNKVTITRAQALGIVAFYEKNSKKVPAFLSKKLV